MASCPMAPTHYLNQYWETHFHYQLDFQKVDEHTGDKWLIHGTKHRKDNQSQNLALPCRTS